MLVVVLVVVPVVWSWWCGGVSAVLHTGTHTSKQRRGHDAHESNHHTEEAACGRAVCDTREIS